MIAKLEKPTVCVALIEKMIMTLIIKNCITLSRFRVNDSEGVFKPSVVYVVQLNQSYV